MKLLLWRRTKEKYQGSTNSVRKKKTNYFNWTRKRMNYSIRQKLRGLRHKRENCGRKGFRRESGCEIKSRLVELSNPLVSPPPSTHGPPTVTRER